MFQQQLHKQNWNIGGGGGIDLKGPNGWDIHAGGGGGINYGDNS